MKFELQDDMLLDEQIAVSFSALAELSGLSEAELRELVECGALQPNDPCASPLTFSGHYVVLVRSVRRLRDDFELDANALPLAYLMLERIRALEAELRAVQARLPQFF